MKNDSNANKKNKGLDGENHPQHTEMPFIYPKKLQAGDGEYSHAERIFRENGMFSFCGKEKIETTDDVAYIFKELENASVENAFIVLVKENKPTIVHLGMGTFINTPVNLAAIKAAYDSLGADHIYFVHNHPSGNLNCSIQDIRVLKTIADMIGDDILQDGIIINTTSGQYGTFNCNESASQARYPERNDDEYPLKLYSFDRIVFSKDYDPQKLKVIRSSEDVAAIVSSQRLGNRQKVSYLILDCASHVIGNLHTLYNTLNSNEKKIANEIVSNTIRFGGTQAVIYGNYNFHDVSLNILKEEIKRLSGNVVSLMDCIALNGNYNQSAYDLALMEPNTEYNTISNKVSDNNLKGESESPENNRRRKRSNFHQEMRKLIPKQYTIDEAYQLERDKFKNADNRNEYAAVLKRNDNWAGAVGEFNALAKQSRDIADEWKNRKYQANKTIVTPTERTRYADEYAHRTTIGAVNEHRRLNNIMSLENRAKEYEELANTLCERIGVQYEILSDNTSIRFRTEDKYTQEEQIFIENMIDQNEKPFSANLSYDFENNKPVFAFPERQNQNQEFRMPEKVKGVELSEENKQKLAQGEKVYIEGMTSLKGKTFNAYVYIDKEKKTLAFDFPEKKEKKNENLDNSQAKAIEKPKKKQLGL